MTGFDAEKSEGFQSYSETLSLMVADIYRDEAMRKSFEQLHPATEYGYIERLQVIIDWAKQFEQLHENTEWDGEWYETLDTFLKEKLF